jgi:hypothetical protein
MAGLNRDFVYVGIKGHVVALDAATGTERWRTKLKGAEFVHVTTDGSRLFGAARGEVFCLDGATGAILWNNALAGMGLGLASLLSGAAPAGDVLPLVAASRKRKQQAH